MTFAPLPGLPSAAPKVAIRGETFSRIVRNRNRYGLAIHLRLL